MFKTFCIKKYSQLTKKQKGFLSPLGEMVKPATQFLVLPDNSLSLHMEVSPELAEEWLALAHPKQRAIIAPNVHRLVEELVSNNFVFTCDPIAFDQQSFGVNGRHRLKSCVDTRTPFWANVVFGMPPETISAIDGGRKRALHSQLQLSGADVPEGSGKILESAFRLERLGALTASVSAKRLEKAYKEEYFNAWEVLSGLLHQYRDKFTVTAWSVMLVVARYYPDEVYDFVRSLCEYKTRAGSPARAYGTWKDSRQGRTTGASIGSRFQMMATLRALQAQVEGVKMASLHGTPQYVPNKRTKQGNRVAVQFKTEPEVQWLRSLGEDVAQAAE
jgi:hypothetical protein